MAVNIITKFVIGQFAKRSARKSEGIATLLKASDPVVQSNVRTIEIILKNMGIDPKSLKSTDDVLKYMNYHKAMMNQHLKKQFGTLDLDQGIKSLEKKQPFQGFTPRVQQDVDSIIKDLKNMEPMAAMKEANLIIGRKGKYKNLSGDEAQRILKDTDDHIFQRDIQYDEFGDPIKPDPEDMASGGRTGYAVGKLVKGGKWFLKSLYDTKKQLMQLDIPLSQKKELMKQADDAIKQIEGGAPIPEQIIQHIRKDPKFKSVSQGPRATDPDLAEMEEVILEYGKRHAEGGRVSYSGGGKAGLPAITQETQTPNLTMQGPQMPVSAPQPTGIPGANLQQNQMDLMQQKMQQNPWMQNQMKQGIGGMQNPQYKGQFRMPFGIGGLTRRAFLKMMAAGAALPFIGKGVSKVAPKAIKETTEVITRGADGMPAYITDLIEVVKAKGTKDFVEGFKRSDYSTVHSYKGVDVIEDGAGNIKIKKPHESGGTYIDDAGESQGFEGISHEVGMEIRKGEWIEPTKTKKGIKTADEYVEYTAKPDMDGKLKDVEEYIDDMDHLELKEIADEVDTLMIKKTKKASGGLAYALGE